MGERIDLTGRQFGQWSVKSYAGMSGKNPIWRCVCTCGNERSVQAGNLKNGKSTGCGCLMRRKQIATARANGHLEYFPMSLRGKHYRGGQNSAETRRAKSVPVSLAPVRLPE